MTGPLPDTYWASPGKLMAGPSPAHSERKVQNANIVALLEAGARCFIDLTIPDEIRSYRVTLDRRAPSEVETTYLKVPILNGDAPNRATLQTILDTIDASIARDRPVYVHCLGGLGRTGTVVAAWLIRHGECTAEEVFDKLTELRRGQPHGQHPSPETGRQRRLVKSWERGL